MEFMTQVLSTFGLGLDESAPEIVKFSLLYLIILCFILINVINISIYLLSIYIVSHEKFLKLIPVEYTYIHKILNYYKNIRFILIIYEVLILLAFLMILIILSYKVVALYIHLK